MNAHGEEIVNLAKPISLAHDFAMDGVQPFNSPFELGGNAGLDRVWTGWWPGLTREIFVNRRFVADFLLQAKKASGSKIAEGESSSSPRTTLMPRRRAMARKYPVFRAKCGAVLESRIFERTHVVKPVGRA